MTSYSQSKQDEFAQFICGDHGTFLDIGCNSPDFQSNTRGLLELGWTGVGIDSRDFSQQWAKYPGMRFICGDATDLNLGELVSSLRVDYLSCDVDSRTIEAMANLFYHGISFRCATVEHDAYRLGNGMRDGLRALMRTHGYAISYPDVAHDGMAYEDWWCAAPKLWETLAIAAVR